MTRRTPKRRPFRAKMWALMFHGSDKTYEALSEIYATKQDATDARKAHLMPQWYRLIPVEVREIVPKHKKMKIGRGK